MCGSGTFPIEAALRAADIPPGEDRRFECETWCKKPSETWVSRPIHTLVAGGDRNQNTIEIARRNAQRAGVEPRLETMDASLLKAPAKTGLIICNPPYGRRAKNPRAYEQLGLLLSTEFRAWKAGVIVSSPSAQSALNRHPSHVVPIRNGGLKLKFIVMEPEDK